MSVFALFVCWIFAISRYVNGSAIASIQLHEVTGGDGSEPLQIDLYWNTSHYQCVIPNIDFTAPQSIICNDSNPTSIPSGSYLQYYLKFRYNSTTPLEWTSISLHDNDTNTYTITSYCISSGMAYTFTEMGHGFASSNENCTQFDYKMRYSSIAIGGDTQFNLLYVDFRNRVEFYPNQVFEGGVRPPVITDLGIKLGSVWTEGDEFPFSAQWDNMLFRCLMVPTSKIVDVDYSCSVSADPVICPGMKSNFWFSMYNDRVLNTELVDIVEVFWIDETNKTYYMAHFCQESHANFFAPITYCTADGLTSYIDTTLTGTRKPDLPVGGWVNFPYPDVPTNLVGIIAPDDLFAFPDNRTNGLSSKVLNAGHQYPQGQFGWNEGLFGAYPEPQCPLTPGPTWEPTREPTNYPTVNPTESTDAPTKVPTNIPTSNPTDVPSSSPSEDPTSVPSSDPTAVPTEPTSNPTAQPTEVTANPTYQPTAESDSPSSNPTLIPTTNPTTYPTYLPTAQPTVYPTTNPTTQPSADPTFEPTTVPTNDPSNNPTTNPSTYPTIIPSVNPTTVPTDNPSTNPTTYPTTVPSVNPTDIPSTNPTTVPSDNPSMNPTDVPSSNPSVNPTIFPSSNPSTNPTVEPTAVPTEATFNPTEATLNPTATSEAPSLTATDDPTPSPTSVPVIEQDIASDTINASTGPDWEQVWLYALIFLLIAVPMCCFCCLCCVGYRYKREKEEKEQKEKEFAAEMVATSSPTSPSSQTYMITNYGKEEQPEEVGISQTAEEDVSETEEP